MTRIAILCPTRGRPEQCRRMVESAYNTSTCALDVYLYFAEPSYVGCGAWHNCVKAYQGPDYPTVQKWNYLADNAWVDGCKLFMLGADDMIFSTSGWDTALVEHYEALKEKVHCYALQDSRDRDGTPHIIVTREWIDAMGYFVPPIFLHWNIDTWTVAIAKANGVFTHMREFLLTHDKPSDVGAGDETHNRIRRQGWHERDSYVAKTMDHVLKAEMVRLDNYLRKREAA